MPNQVVSLTNAVSPYEADLAQIAQRQKLAELLQSQSLQPSERHSYNGIEAPVPETAGLAKILQGLMSGYAQRKNLDDQKAIGQKAQSDATDWITALTQGAQDRPEVPGSVTATPADVMDREQGMSMGTGAQPISSGEQIPTAGGMGEGANVGSAATQALTPQARMALLMKGMTNPLTSTAAQSMLAGQQNLENAKSLALFKNQNQPKKPGVDVPFPADVLKQKMDLEAAQHVRVPVPGVDFPLPDAVAKQKQDIASNRGGQYYAVPTGTGMLIIDKKSGMAQRMGQDANGNLVPLGKPFTPIPSATGQPTDIPQDAMVPSDATPGAAPEAAPSPVLPPSIDAKAQGAVSRAKASNEAIGKVQGGSEANMPGATQTKEYVLGLIDQLANHKDLDKATGFYSILPTIPGVNSDVRSRIDQLQGQNFLQAYQGLRGGGQITEVEGKKAQEAQARLNTAQTAQEFKAALKDMADLVKQRYAVQQQQAGGRGQASSAPDPLGIR